MTSTGGPTTPPDLPTVVGPQWTPDPDAPQQWYPVAAEPDRITRFFDRIAARSPRWLAPVAILACFGGAVGYTLYADPTRSAPDAAPTCLLKLTTGLDCPGCGGTRAFWYLLHGDLPAAARHHILFVFAVPFLLYVYAAWAGKQLFGWRLPQLSIGPVTIGVFLAAWMAFSVLRNLPWTPFTWFYV
ncbi:DUF2752 domain-containing protein [Micromonospora sp. NPDC004704]